MKRRPEQVAIPDPPVKATNVYRVPRKQWERWTRNGRIMFNHVFETMADQSLFNAHPDAVKLSVYEWKTVRWNAAWIAADRATKDWREFYEMR